MPIAPAPSHLPAPPPPVARTAEARGLDQWARTRAWRFLWAYGLSVAFNLALWLQGFPAWRAVAGLATMLPFLVAQLRWSAGRGRWLDYDWILFLFPLQLALSGGMHSPIVGTVGLQLIWYVIAKGWSPTSIARILAMLAALAAMAIAPAHWFGPPLPDRFLAIWTFILLANGFLSSADRLSFFSSAMDEAVAEVSRTREELATSALARARDLELITSGLSHQLKNPLAAVKTIVQVSAQEVESEELRKRLRVVESEVDRMRDVLSACLASGRPMGLVRKEPVDLAALTDAVIALLRDEALTTGIRLERTGAAATSGDRRLLQEALLNLVKNAVEASPPGGRVEVRLSAGADGCDLRVIDRGAGIPEAVIGNIGSPFVTGREHGTGLGVFYARNALHLHGGKLTYEPVEGGGTAAVVRLPAAGPS
ncbi:MAG: HAMP domain-containing sensor histidine kinase [Anaeromyxobacter sp.]